MGRRSRPTGRPSRARPRRCRPSCGWTRRTGCSAARRGAGGRRDRTWTARARRTTLRMRRVPRGSAARSKAGCPTTPPRRRRRRRSRPSPGRRCRVSSSVWLRLTWWPWPTMIPDRIGIIGNTQGVNDNSRPKPKKLATTPQKLLSRSSCAIRELSSAGAAEARGAWAAAAAGWGAGVCTETGGTGTGPGPVRHAADRRPDRRRPAPHRSACVRADSTGPASAQPWNFASTPMRCSPARLRSRTTTACTGPWNTSVSPKFGSFLISPRGRVSDLTTTPESALGTTPSLSR